MERRFISQWLSLAHGSASEPGWVPDADVCEGPEGLVIRMDLAGVEPDRIEVHLDTGELRVTGCRRGPTAGQTAAGIRYHQMEIAYGRFERVLPLPFAVDGEAARATARHGLLEITLPRAASTRPAQIRIQTATP